MKITPIFQKQAFQFVEDYHRHHKKPVGSIFQIGLMEGDILIGVAIVGRPVSRMLQDGTTAEVIRLCCDGTPNACSMLYSACWRAAKAMGYKKVVTYILESEPGTSLKAAGWKLAGEAGGGSWHREDRKRTDKHPTERKKRFEIN